MCFYCSNGNIARLHIKERLEGQFSDYEQFNMSTFQRGFYLLWHSTTRLIYIRKLLEFQYSLSNRSVASNYINPSIAELELALYGHTNGGGSK